MADSCLVPGGEPAESVTRYAIGNGHAASLRNHVIRGVAFLMLLFALAGCGPFFDQQNLQDRADQPAGVLGEGRAVAQTFVAHCDGLSAIDLQLAVYPGVATSKGSLYAALVPGPTAGSRGSFFPPLGNTRMISSARFVEADLRPNEWIRLSFPPIQRSADQRYTLFVWTDDRRPSSATVWASGRVGGTGGDRRFVDGSAAPGSLVYRAYCDESPGQVASEAQATIERSGALWPVELVLCIMPGLALASLLADRDDDPAAFLGLAVGWSVLLAPLSLILATPVRLGGGVAIPLIGAGLAVTWWRRPGLRLGACSLVGLASAIVAMGIRVVDAKGLVAPMWVDPVQHSYVAQLILSVRGVPSTYGPILPGQIFDYHFGFQTIAAYGSWLSGASVADAVLATGQILDALICLAMYRFARDLTGSALAGAVASVLVAMVTTQPAYYVSWGRYPELAGLVALPAAADALRNVIRPPSSRTRIRAVLLPLIVARSRQDPWFSSTRAWRSSLPVWASRSRSPTRWPIEALDPSPRGWSPLA